MAFKNCKCSRNLAPLKTDETGAGYMSNHFYIKSNIAFEGLTFN